VPQTLKAENGSLFATTADNNTLWMNSQGILANRAGTQATSATSGIDIRAAIAALGFGGLQNDGYSQRAICGVYGAASNAASPPAPAYGGYFLKLMARGLFLRVRVATSTTWLTDTDTYVIAQPGRNVYLPPGPHDGMVVMVKSEGDDNNRARVYGNGITITSYAMDSSWFWAGNGRGDIGVFVKYGTRWHYNVWIR